MNRSSLQTPTDLCNFLKEKEIRNLLIGNGYCLSHPVLNSAFNWDLDNALQGEINSFFPEKSKDCPETDLSAIRRNLVTNILKYYVKRICAPDGKEIPINRALENYKNGGWHSRSLFKCCNDICANIFTLNYDPLLYFELLNTSDIKLFDGFISGNDNGRDGCLAAYCKGVNLSGFKSQEYYACKLNEAKNKCKIYYIHGSWVLIENNYDELKKISFQNGITIENMFSQEERPFVILEDRWFVKEKLIEMNPYLLHCVDALKKPSDNLFVFGVSFANDQHILKYLDQSKFENIYICYVEDDYPDKLKAKIDVFKYRKLGNLKKRLKFQRIGPNAIWESTE